MWLKRRRAEVATMARMTPPATLEHMQAMAAELAKPIWSEKHAKETLFQESNLQLRRLEALARWNLLYGEVNDDMVVRAQALTHHRDILRTLMCLISVMFMMHMGMTMPMSFMMTMTKMMMMIMMMTVITMLKHANVRSLVPMNVD